MPVYTYAFSGGQDEVAGYGDKWIIGFGGTWIVGDTWKITFVTTEGDFVVGYGNLGGETPTFCFTYRKRVYLAMGSRFNFSDNDDPTQWEIQGSGAGFIKYLSQLGGMDSVVCFGQMQGRLAVFARKTIQMWVADADPNNFSLVQTIENSGTVSKDSVKSIGDLDVVYLDDTGVRSLRAKEVTLNSTVDDVGAAIDKFVRDRISDGSTACAIVEPRTKDYWLFVKDIIFVLCRHPSAGVQAWATYEPKDAEGNVFTPEKFVVFDGIVYCRTRENTHIVYGGLTGDTYDNTVAIVESPWLNDKTPGVHKIFDSLDVIWSGAWTLFGATNPKALPAPPHPSAFTEIVRLGDGTNPNASMDSSYDTGVIRFPAQGTHIKIRAVSSNTSTKAAVFSAFSIHYNQGQIR